MSAFYLLVHDDKYIKKIVGYHLKDLCFGGIFFLVPVKVAVKAEYHQGYIVVHKLFVQLLDKPKMQRVIDP